MAAFLISPIKGEAGKYETRRVAPTPPIKDWCAAIQTALGGGNLEHVIHEVPTPGVVAYVDEEGYYKFPECNVHGCQILQVLGYRPEYVQTVNADPLHGPMVICGHRGSKDVGFTDAQLGILEEAMRKLASKTEIATGPLISDADRATFHFGRTCPFPSHQSPGRLAHPRRKKTKRVVASV